MPDVTSDYCSCPDCRAPAEVERLTTALREEQEVHAECCRQADTARAEVERLTKALGEALDGWEYAAPYKGEYLAEKHGDSEDIARLRALITPGPCRCEGQPEPGPWHEHACPWWRKP
jgi:hypothetical protein